MSTPEQARRRRDELEKEKARELDALRAIHRGVASRRLTSAEEARWRPRYLRVLEINDSLQRIDDAFGFLERMRAKNSPDETYQRWSRQFFGF